MTQGTVKWFNGHPLVIDLADQEERAPARSIVALMEGDPTLLDQPVMSALLSRPHDKAHQG